MADRKITDLTALAAGSQATGDLLTIVDVSEAAATDKNKKITVENLLKGIPSSVGIGTSSPTTPLSVRNSSSISTYGNVSAQFSDNSTGTIYVQHSSGKVQLGSDSALAFGSGTSATERMRINSSGNVGIGTSAPGRNLVVNGGSSEGVLQITNNTSGTGVANGLEILCFTSGEVQFLNRENADMRFDTNNTERMRIDSSGNVGIGTSSPTAKLTSTSTVQITGFSNPSSGTGLELGYDGTRGVIQAVDRGTSTNKNLYLGAGNVGIGDTSPASKLVIKNTSSNDGIRVISSTTGEGFLLFGDTADNNTGGIVYNHTSDALEFNVNNSERMRIDSSGRVGVGTSSPAVLLHVKTSGEGQLAIGSTDASGASLYLDGDANGDVSGGDYAFLNHDSSGDLNVVNLKSGNIIFKGTSSTERMRITSDGFALFGKTTSSISTAGVSINANDVGSASAGTIVSTVSAEASLYCNRIANDGVLVDFRQGNTQEGTINVSGSTVSYNGGHLSRWSQLAAGAARIEILRGSVLSNLDEMCEWGEEDNEQLNRMKVSDVEGDVNVAGVFQAWDDDDDTYINDFYCAMTGDFVIRIAQGTTVARGDLLMSAGDGTAKPQDDDIVRSKTIAKVTSTTVSTTYADGSYCVPCVLMAC